MSYKDPFIREVYESFRNSLVLNDYFSNAEKVAIIRREGKAVVCDRCYGTVCARCNWNGWVGNWHPEIYREKLGQGGRLSSYLRGMN